MGGRILIIGVGNAGLKIADGLARSGKVDVLILADISPEGGPDIAGMLDSCYDCEVKFIELDGLQQKKVEELLHNEKPDMVVQSASLTSPWAMHGRTDKIATALSQAGLGVQLPAILALLPGAEPLRFSVPAPKALPGGYPVVIGDGQVELDLPDKVDLQEVLDFQWQLARHDGVETITQDGTVLFTDKAKQAVKSIDPHLCEPLKLDKCLPRWLLLMSYMNS